MRIVAITEAETVAQSGSSKMWFRKAGKYSITIVSLANAAVFLIRKEKRNPFMSVLYPFVETRYLFNNGLYLNPLGSSCYYAPLCPFLLPMIPNPIMAAVVSV